MSRKRCQTVKITEEIGRLLSNNLEKDFDKANAECYIEIKFEDSSKEELQQKV